MLPGWIGAICFLVGHGQGSFTCNSGAIALKLHGMQPSNKGLISFDLAQNQHSKSGVQGVNDGVKLVKKPVT